MTVGMSLKCRRWTVVVDVVDEEELRRKVVLARNDLMEL